MSKLEELLKKKAELQEQIDSLRQLERVSAINNILNLMDQNGLTVQDIERSVKGTKATATKSASKLSLTKGQRLKNPTSGEVWEVKAGKRPAWVSALTQEEVSALLV